ncbi:aprataxin and PNK-like factor isoform X2 [Cryptotermes secundus]|uniref:aprataxin and PNK-like factor isoform X2 n=1 Tax=Cryptotermes secundus TaxID=105785 RepID=UPI000CD7D675|nr:aprataxin and PNK-like factor isoform X2 [Cryptotermes secundus]
MNICLIRQDESADEVNLALGEITLGRGPLLGCTDKRVSHQHARLKLSEEGDIILEAIHTNPFFYIKGQKAPVEVIKGDFVVINDGDQFSLVPDGYRFRVVIPSKVENNQSERVEDDNSVTEPQGTGHSYKRHLPLWMTNLAKDGDSNSDIRTSSPQKRRDAIHENMVKKKVKLDQIASDASEEKCGSGSNDDPDHGVSEGKKERENTELHEMSEDEGGGESDGQKVKAEVEESNEDKPSTATQKGDTDTSGTQQGAAGGQKKRCMYGANCYRRSAQHHDEFSHPGDPDYNDKDLPECPYGTGCYRKNKQHRLDFKHTVRLHRARRPQNNLS